MSCDQLDVAVAKVLGDHVPQDGGPDTADDTSPSKGLAQRRWFSTFWRDGGPVLESEGISCVETRSGEWLAGKNPRCEPDPVRGGYEIRFDFEQGGESALIAGMRSFLVKEVGDLVEL